MKCVPAIFFFLYAALFLHPMVRHSRIKEKSVVGTVSQLLHCSEGLFI